MIWKATEQITNMFPFQRKLELGDCYGERRHFIW